LSACANRRGSVCPPVQIDGGLFVRLCKNDGGLFVRGSICPEPFGSKFLVSFGVIPIIRSVKTLIIFK